MKIILEHMPNIARAMIGFFYFFAGISNIYYQKKLIKFMKERKVPLAPIMFWIGIIMQIIGGALIFLSYQLILGAGILIVFVIFATIIFHNFWNMQGEEFRIHLLEVATNISLIGALILLPYTIPVASGF